MEFVNQTPFPAAAFDSLDQRDIRFHTVVIRQTFILQSDGSLSFAPEQESIVETDEYFGELNRSSVRQESDYAPYKPNTDLIIVADAYAPRGQPTSRFEIGLTVIDVASPPELPPRPAGLNPFHGPAPAVLAEWQAECARIRSVPSKSAVVMSKRLVVSGPRDWQKRSFLTRALSFFVLPVWHLTSPKQLTCLPVRFENAYGGENKVFASDPAASRIKPGDRLATKAESNASSAPIGTVADRIVAHTACMSNPIGKGFAKKWYVDACKSSRLEAPQIEAPEEKVRDFGKPYSPRGMGIVARSWLPRLLLAGTYDRNWLERRHPYLPADFDFAYWNSAPADQQITPHLQGNETVVLTNLCKIGTPGAFFDSAGNTQLRLTLPGHLPFVLVRFEEGQIGELNAKLDTVTIDATAPDDDPRRACTVVCVWRATVACEPSVRVLEARMIAACDVPSFRARAADGADPEAWA